MRFVINRDIAFLGGELVLCQIDVKPFDLDIAVCGVHVCTPAAFLNILTDLVSDSDLLRFDSWEGSPRKSRAIINHSIGQLELHSGLDSRIHCPFTHIDSAQPMDHNIVATGEDFGDAPPYLEDYEALVDFTFANLQGMEHEGGVTRLMINSDSGKEATITEFVHWLRVVYWAFYTCVNEKSEKEIYEPHVHGQIFSVFMQVPIQEDLVTSISSARVKVE